MLEHFFITFIGSFGLFVFLIVFSRFRQTRRKPDRRKNVLIGDDEWFRSYE